MFLPWGLSLAGIGPRPFIWPAGCSVIPWEAEDVVQEATLQAFLSSRRCRAARRQNDWVHGGFEVDARPSDALNLAVRLRVPVFLTPELMEQAMPGCIQSMRCLRCSKQVAEDPQERGLTHPRWNGGRFAHCLREACLPTPDRPRGDASTFECRKEVHGQVLVVVGGRPSLWLTSPGEEG